MPIDRSHHHDVVLMPSEVSTRVGFFDRFAGSAALVASRATFFAVCVATVVVWAPSYFLFGRIDTWQLVINTTTTIITFLMVALLQNTQTRADQAVQHKLNAIADGLADVMAHLSGEDAGRGLQKDLRELRDAVGLEHRESTTDNEASGASNESPDSSASGDRSTASGRS